MANFYDYNNGNQQTGGGSSSGFYGGGGYNQQQQQDPGMGDFGGYGGGNTNSQQWQQPQRDPLQPYPSQQQQQPQAQQPQPNFWNPAMASVAAVAGSMDNDTMLKVGKSFLQSGTAKMVPGLESSMLVLRRYFAVDNKYVKSKMVKVLFPFRTKNWKRVVSLVIIFQLHDLKIRVIF